MSTSSIYKIALHVKFLIGNEKYINEFHTRQDISLYHYSVRTANFRHKPFAEPEVQAHFLQLLLSSVTRTRVARGWNYTPLLIGS